MKAKTTATPAAPAKSKFDPKQYVKNGVTEEEVTQAKTSFDLFDNDQGGTIDINGNCLLS